MLRYARPHSTGLGLTMALTLVGVGLDILKPWPLKLIIDRVLTARHGAFDPGWMAFLPGSGSANGLLYWLAGATVLIFMLRQVVSVVQAHVQADVGGRMIADLGDDLFGHLQGLSLVFHGRQRTGDLVRRVTTNTTCVRDLVLWVMLPAITSMLTLVGMFVVLWRMDWLLSLVAIAAAVPLSILIRLFSGPMNERSYAQQELQGEIMTLAEQTLTALPVVQAFSREEHQDRRFQSLSDRTIEASLRATASQLQFKVATGTVTALGTAGVILIGGLHVLRGTLTLGSLLVFLAYLISLYSPLETLAYLSGSYAGAKAAGRRVLDLLDSDEGVREMAGAKELPTLEGPRGHVVMEHVTFGYEEGRAVLRDVNLEARPGETVALVGPTGAGKSTLVSLIPRFFDPWEGRVTLEGQDVRTLTLASLRNAVALVLQDPFLLPLSVAENISYGRPGATHEQIVAAARAANAEEFILELPQQYQTVIGERGASLSGGQKQRLAIARAIVKDASVLILDEPTSALDARTESLLMEALERLMKGRTTFIIAHRLSTIRKANRIVVVDGGKVAEMGTHQELMAREGLYKRLHDLQWAKQSGALA